MTVHVEGWNTVEISDIAARAKRIDRSLLRRLAGDRIFCRGEQYADSGLMLQLLEENETLVAGTRIYRAGLQPPDSQTGKRVGKPFAANEK